MQFSVAGRKEGQGCIRQGGWSNLLVLAHGRRLTAGLRLALWRGLPLYVLPDGTERGVVTEVDEQVAVQFADKVVR